MNFREMLEKACDGYATKREFYAAIGQHENAVIDAKKGKRGLPNKSCVKLAQILGIDELKVIAAKEEWTAKTEEDREFWHPLANAAAIWGVSVAIATTVLSPSPAQAAPVLEMRAPTMCIMSNRRRKIMRMASAIMSIAYGNWKALVGSFYCVGQIRHA